jgi:hypothetical protein
LSGVYVDESTFFIEITTILLSTMMMKVDQNS